MSMIKRGVCMEKVIVSEALYTCPKCGNRDVGDSDAGSMVCAKCGTTMTLTSKPRRKSKQERG